MKVRWSASAELDLHDVLHYVAAERPAAARRLLTAIDRSLARVARFPESGRPVPEVSTPKWGEPRQREVIVAPYRIGYTVLEREIHVLYVVHGARRFPPLR